MSRARRAGYATRSRTVYRGRRVELEQIGARPWSKTTTSLSTRPGGTISTSLTSRGHPDRGGSATNRSGFPSGSAWCGLSTASNGCTGTPAGGRPGTCSSSSVTHGWRRSGFGCVQERCGVGSCSRTLAHSCGVSVSHPVKQDRTLTLSPLEICDDRAVHLTHHAAIPAPDVVHYLLSSILILSAGRVAGGGPGVCLGARAERDPLPRALHPVVARPRERPPRAGICGGRSRPAYTRTLTGWTVFDLQHHGYRFPKFRLRSGHSVRIHTGSGFNTSTDLYWHAGAYIWDNTGDRATLRNANGTVIDRCSWGNGPGSTAC
jgi:hypothetical protein